jgi:hypothetical protein
MENLKNGKNIMASEYAVLMRLGGFVGSNPEILTSFPSLNMKQGESSELLAKSFPHGVHEGDFVEDKHGKYNILSYIFRVKREEDRDDLYSFSVLLSKKDKTEVYKPILEELIKNLAKNNLLTEQILMNNHKSLFEGINQEIDIEINGIKIELKDLFEDIKSKVLKPKPELKGSFF